MNEVIHRATDSINEILECMPQWDIFTVKTKTRLIDTRDLFNRLIDVDSSKTDQTRLFCRYLKRLMDYNESLSQHFWFKLRDDILCLLEKDNDERVIDSSRNYFLRKMNFEEKLEQRELQLKRTAEEPSSLYVLFDEHKEFYEEYLQNCISLHSTIQVHGLIEDVDDFLCKIDSLTCKDRQQFQEKLKSIEIPVSWSHRSFNSLDSRFFTNDDPNNFLPSQRIDMKNSDEIDMIEEILECHRWIVILGDPASAKTTLLRWLTCVFAKAARRHRQKVTLKDGFCLPVRIPILIRIGEFAEWLNQYPTKTLIDYIGEHTWFSKRYCKDECGRALKEIIYHGHALILVDGFDEISDVRQRGEMVDLVKKFIDEYVRAPDMISAFDDRIFDITKQSFYEEIIETQLPSQSSGNQIVITSRIVGYQFRPLNGSYVPHYTLSLMHHQEADKFVKKWLQLVYKSVGDIFLKEESKSGRKMIKKSLKKIFSTGEAVFENSSELLKSNPSLLSLICICIFQSLTVFHPKSRVEVYDHVVQIALRTWKHQEPSIPESVLNNFLIDLATYLHLQSPSGLIDAFDMNQLCCLTLQQQRISNNRGKLREYTKRIILLLDSNTAVVHEKGLEVFGFQHLSFQEYFVARSLAKGSDIVQIVKRMLSFSLNPRFRESLLLAFGWISWQWPCNEYDEFCNFLITQTEDYAIPFGIFFLFDAIHDMFRLPSNSIIFLALNNLINHPSDVIRNTYFISNLSKLPENIIIEWMEMYLKDQKCLLQFCHSFPLKDTTYTDTSVAVRKRIPPVIYQQLWSFHQKNPSKEFLIDQILRKPLTFDDESEQIFNKDLSVCSIHPLVLSAIVAACGGIYVTKNNKDIISMNFSLKQMARETSIIRPIIKYLANTEESHRIKVQTLIEQYESVLQNSSPTDTSVDIVDTFIALICLQGLSQPLMYQKYATYQALSIALERFKRTWFYLKELSNLSQSTRRDTSDVSFMISEMDSQMRGQPLPFSIACACAWKKLGLWHLSNQRNIVGYSSHNRAGRYFHCQPDFLHFIGETELEQLAKQIHSLPASSNKISFAVPFLPQSLQPLYHCMTVAPDDNRASLLPVILLSECLMRLEAIDKYDWNFDLVLPILHPMLKEHMLENYALVLKREIYNDSQLHSSDRQMFWKAMNKYKLLDPFKNQPKEVKILIEIERQRIRDSKATLENHEKDVRLFTASISLARLFQARYRSRKYPAIPTMNVNLDESEEICFAITDMSDQVLRIIALSMIFEMKDPMIFHEKQRDYLQWEMINLFQSLLPNLPLLISALLFVRCYSAHEFFPTSFESMAHIIGKKLNGPAIDSQSREQEAAYVALQQLHNSHLSNYLSNFAKQKANLSNLLHFNSTIFYHYLANTTSFNSLNTNFLLSMYLVELAFDAQILMIYSKDNQIKNVLPLPIKMMELKIATQITNYLQIWDESEIQQIMKDLFACQLIERKALPEIQKWLNYRTDEKLQFFAYYAALQLVSEGSDISNLIEIVEEMFCIDKELRLASIVIKIISSSVADLTIIQQILIKLQSNTYFSSQIYSWISRKETLELILNLQKNLDQSFLSMIRVYSADLLTYLNDHIRTFVEKEIKIADPDKIDYLAVVIKWIIESSIWYQTKAKFSTALYEFIFELLHDDQLPRIQKTIVNALNSAFIHPATRGENIFLQENAITNLERLIYSWKTYSEDMVTICLLAYGNYLLKLQKLRVIRKVSDEMKNVLRILFETSSSEIISIRAGFCLIFAEHTDVKFNTIISWFTNKWNITPIKKYHILLQQTLYDIKGESITSREWEVLRHLEINSFAVELYNYLCSKDNNNCLSDPEPNYLNIAVNFINKNMKEFCHAIQKSSFDENEFKRRLHLRFQNTARDRRALIELYSYFGTLTDEFIDMLQWFEDDECREISLTLGNFKQISGRDTIDRLFTVINFKISQGKQITNCLQILQSLVEMNAITMIELHQRFSHMSNLFHNNNNNNHDVLKLLVNFSCFKTDFLFNSTRKLFTKNGIEREFQKELKNIDRNSPLLLQTQYL